MEGIRAVGLVAAASLGAALALAQHGEAPSVPRDADAADAPVAGEPGTAVIHEEGWSVPIKLPFNDAGWEDSPYLTRDGEAILFFYHPWPDLVSAADAVTEILVTSPEEAVAEGLDGKIYVSRRPFVEKIVHPVSRDDHPAAECCPYVSLAGDLFYASTRESFDLWRDVPAKIYRNGERLDLGTGGEEANPHYCDALDELWFDCPGDTNICVLRDAAAGGFAGRAELAPFPINAADDAVQDFQPFLTDDCRTLYFTSTREGNEKMSIYRTRRLDERGEAWSEPELFLSHEAGVAELSMTADGRELAFAQIFWRENGGVGIDIYYAAKR